MKRRKNKKKTRREYKEFNCYDEEDVFNQEILYLDTLFNQARAQNNVKDRNGNALVCKDEDLDSDEELVKRNVRDSLNDLKTSINSFVKNR